jgi:hypothetical protein
VKTYNLTVPDLTKLIRDVEEQKKLLQAKTDELASRLAEIGAELASIEFDAAQYDGLKDCTVTVEHRGDGHYAVIADGEAVLFIEFGAGATYGYGHPEADTYGMGPGTYPGGKGHWDDPRGWWYKDDAGISHHTYGTAPAMPMYNAVKYLEQHINEIWQEVLAD